MPIDSLFFTIIIITVTLSKLKAIIICNYS